MKYYLVTTGATFGLLFIAHFARAYQEGFWVFREPIFLSTTFVSIAFCLWAIFLLNKLRRG
jgi:hypothetical protein